MFLEHFVPAFVQENRNSGIMFNDLKKYFEPDIWI